MSQITDTIGSALRTTGDVVADAGKSASNTLSKATGSSGSSHHSHNSGLSLKSNSGYSSDAKTLAKDAERMKDKAMADADRRFG